MGVMADYQVHAVTDGEQLHFDGVTLRAVETPGHARHHHAWSIDTEQGAMCFTGDAAATFLPGTEFISLPTPPPEFDLDT